jgi:hypothetical protein
VLVDWAPNFGAHDYAQTYAGYRKPPDVFLRELGDWVGLIPALAALAGAALWQLRPERGPSRRELSVTMPDVDTVEGLPTADLKDCAIIIVGDPVQTHLDPNYQQTVIAPSREMLTGQGDRRQLPPHRRSLPSGEGRERGRVRAPRAARRRGHRGAAGALADRPRRAWFPKRGCISVESMALAPPPPLVGGRQGGRADR